MKHKYISPRVVKVCINNDSCLLIGSLPADIITPGIGSAKVANDFFEGADGVSFDDLSVDVFSGDGLSVNEPGIDF